jgi:hypothetical protein
MFCSGCQYILKIAIARERANDPNPSKVSRHSTVGALEGRLYKTSLCSLRRHPQRWV